MSGVAALLLLQGPIGGVNRLRQSTLLKPTPQQKHLRKMAHLNQQAMMKYLMHQLSVRHNQYQADRLITIIITTPVIGIIFIARYPRERIVR